MKDTDSNLNIHKGLYDVDGVLKYARVAQSVRARTSTNVRWECHAQQF